MRPCNNARLALIFVAVLFAATLLGFVSPALSQQAPSAPPSQQPPLTVDRDPVRSPDVEPPTTANGTIRKQGEGYVLHTDVEEVVLNCTVLDGNKLVPNLNRDDFEILEDGVKQTLISFQHTDLPVSIGLVVDNSGSMSRKRPSVNKSTLDLIQASNPDDEAFVVNFSDEAFIDQEFTTNVNRLRDGLSHIESHGGTALYDAVVASADKLVADAKHPKQVLLIVTDGDDNASSATLEQAIRRIQDFDGPVVYCIGLLFGDDSNKSESRHSRRVLETLSEETGGQAYFPKSIKDVDAIAKEVANDIRTQYTIAYHSTKSPTLGGYRVVHVEAKEKGFFVKDKNGNPIDGWCWPGEYHWNLKKKKLFYT